jgi:Acyl-CoA reductase (LuxC)
MIQILVPAAAPNHEEQLRRLTSSGTLPSFDPLVVDFIDAVSKSVLLDHVTSRMPEMAAVAHWMRKAHVLQLYEQFKANRGNRLWLARGVVLHFAPSNVDSIFLYSWFLSMLAGNANVVRLSQRRGDQIGLLLERINTVMSEPRFCPILARSLVVAYDHEDEITEFLSRSCQLRVIWGGDESVRRLRAIPLNPIAAEVVFGSRFSLAVFSAGAVCAATDSRLEQLVKHFSNDAYWFDQMACSSPRLVVWVGDSSGCDTAKQRFWPTVQAELHRRSIQYQEIVGINKLTTAYLSAGLGLSDHLEPHPTAILSRVHLSPDAGPAFRNLECGGGLFFETEVPQLNHILRILDARDQTLSYFGFEPEELRQLASSLPTRAVDRIVPVGSALNFSTIWDGIDLLQTFSREVDLR